MYRECTGESSAFLYCKVEAFKWPSEVYTRVVCLVALQESDQQVAGYVG